MDKNFTITQTLTREQISDVLCSAFEGGSNYWYQIESLAKPPTWEFDSLPTAYPRHYVQDYPLNPGGAVLISDREDNDHGTMCLDWDAIQKGLHILQEKYPPTYR